MVATPHRLRAVIFAVLQMTLSLGTAANLVFCSAASGHVAVESAFSVDCCPRPPLAEAFGIVHADDTCGCVDTPLLQNPMEPRSRSGLSLPHEYPVTLSAVIPPAPHGRRAAGHGLTPSPPIVEQRMAARRFVVLLI
jgi:hypothetical protein